MNATAIANRIDELRIKYKISDDRWQHALKSILPEHRGDNNHLLLLLNIYAMFSEMDMDIGARRSKMRELLGFAVMNMWTLSSKNAKILQRSLLPGYQLALRDKREGFTAKPTAHKYELFILASGETIGFNDLKAALNQGYFYDGMNANIKVLSVDGAVYRIFLNGVMFEPVDLRE